MNKSTKKVIVVGGVVGAGLLALAGTALALKSKNTPPPVVRVVGAAPADNLTVYLIADSGLLYAKIGNWESAKVGMWDSMIDDVYAKKSQWAVGTIDWTNIYDDLLQLKLSYCSEFGIPYSTEQRNRDMEIRNQRVISSQPAPAISSGSGGIVGNVNAGNLNPFAVKVGGGAATVARYGCLANANAPAMIEGVNIGVYPYGNYRGFISKLANTDWWGPIIRYPGPTSGKGNGGTPEVYFLYRPKLSKLTTNEKTIITATRIGVELYGWSSGMFDTVESLMAHVKKYEMVWNSRCAGWPGRERGCTNPATLYGWLSDRLAMMKSMGVQ